MNRATIVFQNINIMNHYTYGVDMGVVKNMEGVGSNIAFAISTRLNGVEQYVIPVSEIDLIRRRIYDEYSVVEVLRFNKKNLHFAFITHQAALEFHVMMIQMIEKILRSSRDDEINKKNSNS